MCCLYHRRADCVSGCFTLSLMRIGLNMLLSSSLAECLSLVQGASTRTLSNALVLLQSSALLVSISKRPFHVCVLPKYWLIMFLIRFTRDWLTSFDTKRPANNKRRVTVRYKNHTSIVYQDKQFEGWPGICHQVQHTNLKLCLLAANQAQGLEGERQRPSGNSL